MKYVVDYESESDLDKILEEEKRKYPIRYWAWYIIEGARYFFEVTLYDWFNRR